MHISYSIFLLLLGLAIIKYNDAKKIGNIFMAIAHMEPLVEIERRLIALARGYLNDERRKLNGLKHFAKQVDEALKLSKDEPIKYLGNPINSYLIIKRFTSGWVDLAERLTVDDRKVKDINTLLTANDMYLPTHDKDMVGATEAIFRLQDTYDISARNVSNGEIKGIRPSVHKLSAKDCLDIAIIAHANRRYVRMKEWLDESERLAFDPNTKERRGELRNIDLFEYKAWGFYLSGNMEKAIEYTQKILAEDPLNEYAIENERTYRWYLKNINSERDPEMTYVEGAQRVLDHFVQSKYTQACRNENPERKLVKNNASLVCWYHRHTPRFILKPGKVMRVHDNPEVLVFVDLLNEWEVRKLKEIATPRLRPAEVINENDEHVTATYRVSKNLFFDHVFYEDRNISKYIQKRIEEITGLDMKYAENLQINNYGLGGQYEFHIDHGTPGSYLDNHKHGNRLATLLFYLSDVERGGCTVFTQLGLKMKPRRGDGLFWYNLHFNGTGIPTTQHASCPVVSGSKWVVNKWIHTHGNEFLRPCKLNQFE